MMTNKEKKQVEIIAKKVLAEFLGEEDCLDDDSPYLMFSAKTIEKIEDFMGEPIRFMGIS